MNDDIAPTSRQIEEISEQDISSTKQSRPVRSLSMLINGALVCIFFVFIMLTWLAYEKLADFKDVLQNFTDDAIPEIVSSANLNNHMTALAFATNSLAEAQTDAARRIAEATINARLEELKTMPDVQTSQVSLMNKLGDIGIEFGQLSTLVQRKLSLFELLGRRQNEIYRLTDLVVDRAQEERKTLELSPEAYDWVLNFKQIAVASGKIVSSQRLQEIRQESENVKEHIARLRQGSLVLAQEYQQPALRMMDTVETLMFGDQGLIPLTNQYLRVSGRARGHGNFVSYLITDYAKLIEFKTYQLNDAVIRTSKTSTEEVNDQLKIMGILFLLGILMSVFLTFFTQNRVIHRLVILFKKVQARQRGNDVKVALRGNDEIAAIDRALDQYTKTIETQKQKLMELTLLDQLTRIPNRRAMDHRLSVEMHTSARQQWWMSLILMDIDFFKQYNDNYGHQQGDNCLIKVASILTENIQRSADFVARYGGEEFVCILPDTDERGAIKVAERLLSAFSAAAITHEYSSVAPHITLSLGIASYTATEPVSSKLLIETADRALYRAKQEGRNRYVAAKARATQKAPESVDSNNNVLKR